jgi:hypothetical protein
VTPDTPKWDHTKEVLFRDTMPRARWSRMNDAMRNRICELLNLAEPDAALVRVLEYAERYADLNDEGPDGDCAKSCAAVRKALEAQP